MLWRNRSGMPSAAAIASLFTGPGPLEARTVAARRAYSALAVTCIPTERMAGLLPEAPAALDAPLQGGEEHRVDHEADHKDHEHEGHHPGGVGEVPGVLQAHAERGLVGDDDDQLAGHEGPPAERPALLEPRHETGEGGGD